MSAAQPQHLARQNSGPQAHLMATAQTYSGPTPPPDHVEAYERMHQGAARVFLEIAQSEVSHRQKLENARETLVGENVRARHVIAKRGQALAFVIAILAIGGCIWLGNKGESLPATVLGGGSLAAIVVAFLRGNTTAPGEK
jgi:uncharacterized membrane protein